MSLTLKDLQVKDHNRSIAVGVESLRPASLADLVEVLRNEKAAGLFEAKQTDRGWRAHLLLPRSANDGDLWLAMPLGDTP